MRPVALLWCFMAVAAGVVTSPPDVETTLPTNPVEEAQTDAQVEEMCIKQCPLQNRTDSNYNYACDYDCNVDQCAKGCKLWREALISSCQKACNITVTRLTPPSLHCLSGCNEALSRHWSALRKRLGTPPAPALVPDSLTPSTLRLQWRRPTLPAPQLQGVGYHVQWRYEEMQPARWQYARDAQWDAGREEVKVEGLQAYTKYRFRIALLLTAHTAAVTSPIVSRATVVISTLAGGAPASPPMVVSARAVDCTRIAVSWLPGPFSRGPLLSYTITIQGHAPRLHTEVKDLTPETTTYVFRNLRPSTNYTIHITERNSAGTGPPATVLVSTPPEPQVKGGHQPEWLICTKDSVILQKNNMISEPIVLYHSSYPIKGMAVHIRRNLLFVSDSSGHIRRINITGERGHDVRDILDSAQVNFSPLSLSVDWLNEQLYVLGEVKGAHTKWQIARCGFDGSGLTVAYAGLTEQPHTVEIDPYNGYLFWMIQKYYKGLYRLNISDISNGIKHEVKPEHILKSDKLGAFIVDYAKFRLYVADEENKTIYKVSLDGKETEDIRSKNVIKSRLESVVSLATSNDTFFWTDGYRVFLEEFHTPSGSYFHNAFLESPARKYVKIVFYSPDAQPVPVPVNPPTGLEAVLGNTIARVRWNAPYLLGGQGKGAYQNWLYKLVFLDSSGNVSTFNSFNTTSATITTLSSNTSYVIKVAAYTISGTGPYSRPFQSQTFPLSRRPSILWSRDSALRRSSSMGDGGEILLLTHGTIGAITWEGERVYLAVDKEGVEWSDMVTGERRWAIRSAEVGSIAVDWLGKKLYWSNPQQQLIIRSGLNGGEQEALPVLTIAKELAIDSARAYLYWATVRTVECSRLNGADRMTFHELELFSTKQVMSLTLDPDTHNLYWLVRGAEGSGLYRASTKDSPVTTQVALLRGAHSLGPLSYLHRRLLWLREGQPAALSDLKGDNVAQLGGLTGARAVCVVDDGVRMLADSNVTIQNVNVIPEAVDKNSIRVIGTDTSFNITWEPIRNVNYGTVFYEIQINTLNHTYYNSEILDNTTVNTTINTVRYWGNVHPFTPLHVSVRAFTYWGSATHSLADVHSPPSTPSAPRQPRAYVTKEHIFSNHLDVTFRWDKPLSPNGIIRGYRVIYWYLWEGNKREWEANTSSHHLEFKLRDLSNDNTVYYFQVQAFTSIGLGSLSPALQVNTSRESPIPTLLVATRDSILIQDIDTGAAKALVQGIDTPEEVVCLKHETIIFWVDRLRQLYFYRIRDARRGKVLDVNGNSRGLTIDWIARNLYYVQTNNIQGSIIYKLDLNHMDKGVVYSKKIIQTPNQIADVEISPFTKKLYWTELRDTNRYELMQSNIDGTGVESFFLKRKKRDVEEIKQPACNCREEINLDKTFTIDHSDAQTKPLLIFIDTTTKNVISADKDGCFCNIIANNTIVSNTLPFERIKSDFGTLYWTNPSQGLLYALKRDESNILTKAVKVNDITIFGTHMQPYPPKECLSPKQGNFTVTLLERSATSLTLIMPDLKTHAYCGDISIASAEYDIYYSELSESSLSLCSNGSCNHNMTFNKEIVINGLKPFTKYLVSVSVRNHFTEDKEVIIGPSVVLQTAPGAPSKPRNVTAHVLNPTVAEVTWLPPEQLNGETVHYQIHWQTEVSTSGGRQKGEQPVDTTSGNDTIITTLLRNATPNETYTIWIRAYSEGNDSWRDSDSVQVRTYPEPSGFNLTNRTAYSLHLSWRICEHVANYSIQYAPLTSNEWIDAETSITNSDDENIREREGKIGTPRDAERETVGLVEVIVNELKPKTQYRFRVSLLYDANLEWYVWPSDPRFIFETLGDRPSPPGTPVVQYVRPAVFKVWWEAARDNGAPIDLYILEALRLLQYRSRRSTAGTQNRTAWSYDAPSVEEVEILWTQVYNGTGTSWIISGLDEQHKYTFRALALNAYGLSDPSQESLEFDFSETARVAESQSQASNILIGITVPLSLVIVFITWVVCRCGRCSRSKKMQEVLVVPRGTDVELATLRELPRRGIHNTNILYLAAQPTEAEISLLPHIRREQFTLTKFLGSGAFGEVFEGRAKDIQEKGEMKVAVKALRKGASEQEKNEFLQEATLMSHFKHKHILQLLGVCLDNDPNYIIMELMEGGDLLTYLRNARKSLPMLTVRDLLRMCRDVSEGCKYLEEMHFVHRDLACRNCLVSSVDPETRIVKIGDFGLARDIYRNDYYKKEGEGLLPVRWMAPESLVDGVFTSQSDVWSFGVLLWEIMTLGQQPYPARSNLEVLHYVRIGGRLKKPHDCPEELHALMLKCWNSDPYKRPTFKYCLEVLEKLLQQNLRKPVTGAHEGQYISTVPDGIIGSSWDPDDDPSMKERHPFLPEEAESGTTESPKYLEIISNGPVYWEGYELPSEVLQSQPTPVTSEADDVKERSETDREGESKYSNVNVTDESDDGKNVKES